MGFNGDLMEIPSGYVKIAIENGPVEIVDFPIEHGWIFPVRYVSHYQRVWGFSPIRW